MYTFARTVYSFSCPSRIIRPTPREAKYSGKARDYLSVSRILLRYERTHEIHLCSTSEEDYGWRGD